MTIKINFSAHPGAYERHLQRKFNNPLFESVEQHRLAGELEQAREKDQQDLRAFLDAFQETMQEAANLDGAVDADVILDLKERLERLYVTSTSLAGDLTEQRQALGKLIDICMNSIRQGAEGDPSALDKLDQESHARIIFFKLLGSPLVPDLMRGDAIISAEELVPTLLSQDEATLMNALELFEVEHLALIHEQASTLLADIETELPNKPELDKRLKLIADLAVQKPVT